MSSREGYQFRWYLGGVASWFTGYGIQMLVFPWLVAVVLREPAQRVGIAQMAMLAPAIVFMLLGGAVADRADHGGIGHRRQPLEDDRSHRARRRAGRHRPLDRRGGGSGGRRR